VFGKLRVPHDPKNQVTFVVTMLITREHELTWYHATMAVLYLADFDPTRPMFFGHLWSLSVEEQFYFLWAYLLIPHDAVDEAKTIQGLAAGFTLKSPKTAVKV
jgi:peptidoglycan/LPS O-acetylase OafA/YrhL